MTTQLRTQAIRIVSASVVAIAASLAFPFLIHLLPTAEGVRLGSTLLPIFWAPLIALLVFGPIPAVAAAALAPSVNNLVTGLPPNPVVASLTLELLAFVVIALLLLRWLPRNPLVAPMSYAAAHLIVTAGFWLSSGVPEGAWAALAGSFWTGLPGIGILLALNVGLLRFRTEEPGS